MMECRLCLCPLSTETSVPIFGISGHISLKQQIWFCCNLHIEENDGFPGSICMWCKDKLHSFITFRNACIRSDETLKMRSIEISVIKTENDASDAVIMSDGIAVSPTGVHDSTISIEYKPLEKFHFEENIESMESQNTKQTFQNKEAISSCSEKLQCKCCTVKKSYQCHDCLRIFRTKGSLSSHIKAYHVKSKVETLATTPGIEFSTNQKGNAVLTYGGYQYNRFRGNRGGDIIGWRCAQYRQLRCRASVKTLGKCIVKEPSAHNHDSCPQKAKANIALSRMRESVKHIGNISQVFANEMMGLNDDIVAHLPKRESIMRGLLRHKQLRSTKT